MKQNASVSPIAVLTAGLGGIALVLRVCLYGFATDEKGLLISGHPLETLLWLVTAATALLVLVCARKASGTLSYAPSTSAAIGCFLFAVGIGVTAFLSRESYSPLATAAWVSALPVIPALAYNGLCRKTGKQPFFLCHGLVCVHLVLYATFQYQNWSSNPQLQDAFFPMMGCVFLMLFAYCQTAADADMGKPRTQLFSGLLAAFTCIAAIANSSAPLLYLTGALWALTNLCTPRKEEPA